MNEGYPELVMSAMQHAASDLDQDATGHDIYHVERVMRVATLIATAEDADLEKTQLIAALHDVADFKFTGDELSGSVAARSWLIAKGCTESLADTVAADIAGISFKGAGTKLSPLTLEGMCVQDADRLDAIGAIGVARCFAYGGSVGRSIYDPTVPPAVLNSAEAYLNNLGTSINHFYEKLLLIRERMRTDTGRMLAEDRHAFVVGFLEEFMREWDFGASKYSSGTS